MVISDCISSYTNVKNGAPFVTKIELIFTPKKSDLFSWKKEHPSAGAGGKNRREMKSRVNPKLAGIYGRRDRVIYSSMQDTIVKKTNSFD